METPNQRLERRLDEYLAHYEDPVKARRVFREYLEDISKIGNGIDRALSLVQQCNNSEDLDIRLDVLVNPARSYHIGGNTNPSPIDEDAGGYGSIARKFLEEDRD